jgi:hypothetical protein
MKTSLLTVLFVFAVFAATAQIKVDTLTNEKIIQLSKIGLQPDVIINKINTSINIFDVSTDALIRLSENNVSPDVINEMMRINNNHKLDVEDKINSKNPNAMHKSGIYYFNQEDKENPLKKIQVVRITSFVSGGGGYGGFGGSSTSAVLTGGKSKQQVNEDAPIFYFYFDSDNNSKADWDQNAASPNEFALVKVIEKRDQRLFKVSGSSSFSYGSNSSVGIPEKSKIPFEFDQISEGIYKVTFKEPLRVGEYCFVFASETNKVYDFGIPKGK